MKNSLIYGVSLALILSLAACGSQPTETASTPEAPMETVEPAEPDPMEIEQYFQPAYDNAHHVNSLDFISSLDEEGVIDWEISCLRTLLGSTQRIYPTDYKEQYLEWRAKNIVDEETSGTGSGSGNTVVDTGKTENQKPVTQDKTDASTPDKKPSGGGQTNNGGSNNSGGISSPIGSDAWQKEMEALLGDSMHHELGSQNGNVDNSQISDGTHEGVGGWKDDDSNTIHVTGQLN